MDLLYCVTLFMLDYLPCSQADGHKSSKKIIIVIAIIVILIIIVTDDWNNRNSGISWTEIIHFC